MIIVVTVIGYFWLLYIFIHHKYYYSSQQLSSNNVWPCSYFKTTEKLVIDLQQTFCSITCKLTIFH